MEQGQCLLTQLRVTRATTKYISWDFQEHPGASCILSVPAQWRGGNDLLVHDNGWSVGCHLGLMQPPEACNVIVLKGCTLARVNSLLELDQIHLRP